MLNTVGRFIYIKYLGICYVEHCGKIDLINKLLWILYVEHCGKIYLHNILGEYFMLNTGKISFHKLLGNTVCWTRWEDLFTQIYIKYWEIRYVERWENLFTQNIGKYFMLNTGNIYLHKILSNTVCWALWADLFTQNTEEYCMVSTVGRFIYIKYWGLLFVEHYGNIYLNKIMGITLCWALWEELFTQNT